MSTLRHPCSLCIVRGCAFFSPTDRTEVLCLCGHSKTDHPPPSLTLEPRGGFPSRNCQRYSPIGGRPVTDFYQMCECGGYYSVHGPLTGIGPSNRPRISVPIPAMDSEATAPSLSLTGPTTRLHMPSVITHSQAPPLLTQPIASSSRLPGVSPYQPHPEYTFGIPIGQPMTIGGRQPNTRTSASTSRTQGTAATRTRKLELTVMIILLPRDLDNAVIQDPHGLPNIHQLAPGERLAQDLRFLQARNLATTATFRCSTSETNLLPQIAAHVDLNMIQHGPYKYSSQLPLASMTCLPTASPSEPSYEMRTIFAKLPFRFVRIGNGASPSLSVAKDIDFRHFTYKKLKERFSRMSQKHPTDPQIHGLLYICPKGGIQLVGPINDDLSSIHTCYTDYILAGIEKSKYLVQENKTLEEQLEEWKALNSYSCRTTCPSNLPQASEPAVGVAADSANNSDDEDEPWDLAWMSTVTGIASTAATIEPTAPPTTLTPLLSTVALSVQPISDPVTVTQVTQPVQSQPVPSTLAAPQARPHHEYNPDEPSRFRSLRTVELEIEEHRDVGPESETGSFCVEGDTVAHVAQGLLVALTGIQRNRVAAFNDVPSLSTTFTRSEFSIKPDNINLSKIFSCTNWFWRAGHEDHIDAMGTGVIREILSKALEQCIASELTILEDTGNNDGYLTIKISPDYVSSETLNLTYALGVICAIFMIKAHSGPDPISPALIQAAIGGVDSLIDHAWVKAISPDLATILALMPENPSIAIPQNRDLRCLVESRLIGSRYLDIQRSPQSERPTIIRSLYINSLLGTSEKILKDSPQFKAFSDGLNLFLSATLPSFFTVIKSSSKYLLTQTYNRRITSGHQLTPHLKYTIAGDDDFTEELERILPNIKRAVEHYLLGIGHPFPDRVAGLVEPEVMLEDNADAGFRARRFVKALSGLPTMPPTPSTKFKVIIYQNVRAAALFGGHYKIDSHLIPPTPHACLFEVDLWANEPFLEAVALASHAAFGEDTEFDWMMHMAFMQLGDDQFNA